MRTEHLRSAAIALTLLGGASLAMAQAQQQRPDKPEHSTQEPSTSATQGSSHSGVFINGRLAVPGAPDGDTVPSKFSEKNAADDKLPIVGYTFKYLTDAQRRAIYQSVKGDSRPPTIPTIDARVGDELPSTIALAPLPADLAAQFPEMTRYRFAKADDKLVLVDPANRAVVGVIPPTAN